MAPIDYGNLEGETPVNLARQLLLAVATLAILVPGGARLAKAADPAFLVVGAGVFDVDDTDIAGHFRAEFRADKVFFIEPLFGMSVTSTGAFYGYGGFNIDILIGRRWVFSPGFAVGGYVQGNGKNLGSTIEFRSGGELAYRLDNRARIGLAVHHISNAGLTRHNPGTEIVVINYAIPLGRLFSGD